MAIGIGATIGAGINVYRNWDAISKSGNINWEKLAGFAAVGAIEGGFIAAAPGAGFTRVAASTFGRAIIGGTFKNIGNGILGGHVDSPKSFLFNSTIGAVTAGTLSGIGSILKGGNFFTGARVVPGEVIVGKVEKEVVKESGEKALEWVDDFAGRKAGETVKMTDETFSQALFKESIRQTEKIGDYSIYGTKGMVGDVFNRNIFLIETSNKGLGNFKNMISAMEKEALNAGAKKISIFGSSIINQGFLNPSIARRFGYTFQQSGSGVFLQKILNP